MWRGDEGWEKAGRGPASRARHSTKPDGPRSPSPTYYSHPTLFPRTPSSDERAFYSVFHTQKSIVRCIPELVGAEDAQRFDRIHTRSPKMSVPTPGVAKTAQVVSTLSTAAAMIESAKQLAAWTAVDKHVGKDCKVRLTRNHCCNHSTLTHGHWSFRLLVLDQGLQSPTSLSESSHKVLK